MTKARQKAEAKEAAEAEKKKKVAAAQGMRFTRVEGIRLEAEEKGS